MLYSSKEAYLMGATVRITLYHERAEQLLEQAFQLLRELEHRFSANSSSSELMTINEFAGKKAVKVHPELLELITIGREHSLASDRQMNVAIGPLVQLWRIGFSNARVPSEEEIRQTLRVIDPQSIEINDQTSTIYLQKKGMKLDLGCIAKGYSADRVVHFLKQSGVTSALINLGGNIITIGTKLTDKKASWKIGIQDPSKKRGIHVMTIPANDVSVVTSGTYVRRLKQDNQEFHHLFDSRTGYPYETELASLTIISKRSIDGEIWTTRLFGKKISHILWEIEQTKEIEGILIDNSGRVICTSGVQKG